MVRKLICIEPMPMPCSSTFCIDTYILLLCIYVYSKISSSINKLQKAGEPENDAACFKVIIIAAVLVAS